MYDVLILVSEQEKAKQLHIDDITILPMNKKFTDRKKFYFEFWPYINNTSGILYKIFTKGGLGEFECGDELFDFDYSQNVLKDNDIPYFLTDEPDIIKDDLDSISLNASYKESFSKVIRLLLSDSPIKTIMFLCRGQSHEKEIILGKININKFLEMLAEGKIYTNVCYIVGE